MKLKKLSFLMFTALFSMLIVLNGCKKDEEEKIDLGPTLSLKTGEGYTSSDFEVIEGDTLKFGVIAAKSTTHNNFLTRFNIYFGDLTLVDSVINVADFDADYSFIFNGIGTTKMTFKITAQQGLTAEKELNVVIKEPPVTGVEVMKKSNIEMGSFNDPIGSFFNTADTTIYTLALAKENQEKVDFLFFKGASNQNAIAAPSDSAANTVYNLQDWTIKNETQFTLTEMTPEEFIAIGDLHVFPEFDTVNASSNINQLEVGNILMFKTVADKLGYIHISDLYSRGDRMKMDIVVEK
jgi:hypothetical protein